MLRVCTWNINGIRTLSTPIKRHLDSLEADIICFQETKANRSLPAEFCQADGYTAYFSHCTSKSGYSGVCIFCRNPIQPTSAVEGFEQLLILADGDTDPSSSVKGFDSEGRVLAAQFGLPLAPSGRLSLTVICLYCPRVDPEKPDRAAYRIRFFELLRKSVVSLISSGSYVVLAGDFNIVHKAIDHCCPEEFKLLDPEPRSWMDSLLVDPLKFRDCVGSDVDTFDGSHLVDLFRLAQPDRQNAFSCWNTRTGARQTNYGTRIDYILCDTGLARRFPPSERLGSVCDLRVDVLGSDHCPVWARLPLNNCQLLDDDLSAGPPPALCTCFWPQCQKRQSRLWQFLQPTSAGRVADEAVAAGLKRATSDCQKTNGVVKRQKQAQLTVVRAKSLTPVHDAQDESHEAGIGTEVPTGQKLYGDQSAAAVQWSQLFRRPQKAPLCRGHQEPCVRRTVKRASANQGRDFWVCPRPEGAPGNPEARCSTFIWVDKMER